MLKLPSETWTSSLKPMNASEKDSANLHLPNDIDKKNYIYILVFEFCSQSPVLVILVITK